MGPARDLGDRHPVVIVCPDSETIAARALDLVVDGLLAASRRGEARSNGGGSLKGQLSGSRGGEPDLARGGSRVAGSTGSRIPGAHLALTGGSSAASLFRHLREDVRARQVDWSRVHVWQGDERFVPHTHPESNWAGALRDWLERDEAPRPPAANWHPIPVADALAGGHDESRTAQLYGEEMARALPRRNGLPAFDVWLLGVGSDGHILSAFPGSEAVPPERELDPGTRRWALGVPSPRHIEPHLPRVTLSPHLLPAAGTIVVMVPGEAKAAIVARCFTEAPDPRRLPAHAALLPNAVWLLDQGSAAKL